MENASLSQKLSLPLLLLRLSVFLVMLMWTLDKFINTDHAKTVYQHFYFLSGFDNIIMYAIAGLELLLLIAFVVGYKKKCSYGIVFFLHFVSTVSSYKQYFDPWKNLLFFAAWPMLAACFTLYVLRDYDTKFVLTKFSKK